MEIKQDKILSTNLNREINVKIYGHYGLSILVFPAINNEFTEFEENGVVEELEHSIKLGKCKIFCIDNIEDFIWLKKDLSPEEKSNLHFNFNNFIENELISYIFSQCGGPVPIITAGAAYGAYFAVNSFFRRPDLFLGTIGISGFYDITKISDNYFDDNCYYNSPIHYLPNLNDNFWLSHLYMRKHIYLISGSGEGEEPQNSQVLSDILNQKGIQNNLDIRDNTFSHSYESWKKIFKYYIDTQL